MIRVLQLYQPTSGGVGRHVRDVAEGLAERGYEVLLCGPALPTGMAEHTPGVTLVPLALRRAIATQDIAAFVRLEDVIRRTRADLVHVHSSKAGALGRLARVLHPGTPTVYTPHGYAFAGFFEHSRDRLVYREIERLLAPLTSRVVCVCDAEARLAASVGSRARIRVVHNGIASTPPGPPEASMTELGRSGPVICALTQLRPGKGIETLVDAAPAILRSFPSAKLAIWGEGEELEPLIERARSAGVDHATVFPGTTADPLAVLRGASVFVHPSLAESFPYVLLEAMAAVTPIVASDVGGVGEAIIDGESGILVPARSAARLAEAVIALLADEPRRRALAAKAHDRVTHTFTLAAMIDGLIGVYDEVAPARPRA